MNLQQTTRGIQDLLYTLGTSLERFRGANGLQHLVTTGKLSLLSLFGVFERTRDEEYEKRSAAVNETRRCLLQLVDDFEGITESTAKLVQKVDRLLGTLEQFHCCCDMEVDGRANVSGSDVPQLGQYFRQIREASSQLKGFLDDFSTSKTTCVDVTRTAIKEIEKVNTDTSCNVAAALTDFDRQRRRLQMRESEMMHAMSRSTSREDPAVRYAELNCVKESEALESLGRKYIDSLGNAMTATHFALEQSSMTGWASSNVFFVQLGQLFSELSTTGKAIAAHLLSIKNSQKVSHQLSEEKRRILQEQRAAATAAGVATNTETDLFSGGADVSPGASFPLVTSSPAGPSARVSSPTEGPGRGSVNLDDLFH
ncbi:conserved hypothetical protein [Leishmania mexicana MHOM/GT/2001/U1103]|uniref:Uncharacterized protein n=1 Tax=Leishmania mexicana (strain MHOM/GT/2001/U1103) TaxID=929439 RepID=E9ALJ1_LEIMU|nr:conserved hypothetical protein [Leishmania mexicana MHOM/GT/2001/U1103]CBZ23795.1 conserved hypothetical protein [Leishmania mexicana MHOM/GT/2001/U1103]